MKFTNEQLSELLSDLCAPEDAVLDEPGAVECLLHLRDSPEATHFLQRMDDDPVLRAAFRQIEDEIAEVKLNETSWSPDENAIPGYKDRRLSVIGSVFAFAADKLPGNCATFQVESLELVEDLRVNLTEFEDRVLVEITTPEGCGASLVDRIVRWRIGECLGELKLQSGTDGSAKASVCVNTPWSEIMTMKQNLKSFWLLA